jgi:hypothetical protein
MEEPAKPVVSESEVRTCTCGRSWKRRLLFAAGIGAGGVVAASSIIGVLVWLQNRPKPPKPWDAKTLTASYYIVDTGIPPTKAEWTTKKALEFYYVVTNHSEYDYTLGGPESIRLVGRLEDTNSLVGDPITQEIMIDSSVFIPAGQSVRLRIFLPSYGFDEESPDDPEGRQAFKKKVAQYVADKLPNLNGFVLLALSDNSTERPFYAAFFTC